MLCSACDDEHLTKYSSLANCIYILHCPQQLAMQTIDLGLIAIKQNVFSVG